MTIESLETRIAKLTNEVLETAQQVAAHPEGMAEKGAAYYKRFQELAAENGGKNPALNRPLADLNLDIGYIRNVGNSLTSTRLAQILRDNATLAAQKKQGH
jgi:hypothetical protein